jgi:signal transduction histidine kinase
MTWYRSLYWRIAIGLVAVLAAMLIVQAVVFVWAISRSERTLPGESPGRYAQTVAVDLAAALERDPNLDLEHYVREQYESATHPFFVLLADGRVVASSAGEVPPTLLQMARERLRRRGGLQRFERTEPPGFGGGRGAGARGGFGFARPAPVIVDGRVVAVVMVPPRAPFRFLISRLGPILALVATGVLVLGTIGAAVVIFGPARRRLRELEDAARRLGAGDLSARAPERGGDEIAAVAGAFNAMAADLASADRTRRQLLADVSHELNTPVTAMRGYIETLQMPELTLDEAARARYLGIIADETARLERLIGDLLDLARVEGGGGSDWQSTTVPIAPLFARVAARHERASAGAGVAITSTVEPGAEAVVGDPDRLEQALQNLAANALRYAPSGTSVRLTARRADDGVSVTVEDEGAGIAPEHLPHIFDRFYKVESSRGGGARGGSGLGLSIAKAIAERLGGRLSVTSRPGRTIFALTGLRPA